MIDGNCPACEGTGVYEENHGGTFGMTEPLGCQCCEMMGWVCACGQPARFAVGDPLGSIVRQCETCAAPARAAGIDAIPLEKK